MESISSSVTTTNKMAERKAASFLKRLFLFVVRQVIAQDIFIEVWDFV